MFCTSCGRAVDSGASFCGHCGAPAHALQARARSRTLRLVVLLAVVAIAAAGAAFLVTPRTTPAEQPPTAAAAPDAAETATFDPARLSPSVLTLHTFDAAGQPLGQGSGFIVGAGGLAVTNWHVAKGATSISATSGTGESFTVTRLVSADEANDLVTLQLSGAVVRSLLALPPADSRTVKPGVRVYTISTPVGLSHTVSDGMLSGVRTLNGVQVLQITAPISPGSSGGPVFNEQGQVIGVITSQFSQGQQLNFAVPIDMVVRLMAQPTQMARAPEQPGAPDSASLFGRALNAFNADRFAEAAELFDEVWRTYPTEYAALYNAGLAYTRLGDYARAADSYQRFVERADPQSDEAQRAQRFLALYATELNKQPDAAGAAKENR